MSPTAERKSGSGSSRRSFMRKLGAVAAASNVGLGKTGTASPGPMPGMQWAQAGALSEQPMPNIRIGEYKIGRLIFGSNAPGLHFSFKERLDAMAWHTPERILQQNRHMEELGINCMEFGDKRMAEYKRDGGNILWSTRGRAKSGKNDSNWVHPRELAKGGAISIHHVGYGDTGTDAWWRQGKLDVVREYCKMVRDAGVLVAVTSHRPEVFMEIESQGWDVDYYMCCLYKYGRTHDEWVQAFKSNPDMMPVEIGHPTESDSPLYGGEVAFVQGDPPEMLKVVQQCRKPCWVYKILACERLAQDEDVAEEVFKYVLSNIKSSDAVVVGMWDKYLDEFAINKEYVVKYTKLSIPVA